MKWVRRLSQDNQIKQRRAWLLLGQVTAERSCPCKRPACPAIGGGSEVTFKPLVPSRQQLVCLCLVQLAGRPPYGYPFDLFILTGISGDRERASEREGESEWCVVHRNKSGILCPPGFMRSSALAVRESHTAVKNITYPRSYTLYYCL
ncbi:hypothetical protein J6590_026906 [Homalodisca vitripennis]|nr:hypothetical protein J6590_026906 [Homalodisca vitripennis]